MLAAVEADPSAPVAVAIVAPGGYGKTTFLRALRRIYENAGVRVADQPGSDCAVLVDDAHTLPEDKLAALADASRLVITLRPWPRSTALTELTRSVGSTVLLTPLDRSQVRTLATGVFGAAPAPELVEFLHTQTGGVPAFVDRVVKAMGTRPATELPEAALAAFRYDFDLLDADVLQYVLAAQAGAGLRTDLLASLLDRDANEVVTVMEAARATGLLGHDGALLPICHRAINAVIPAERGLAVRQRLAELLLERGESVLPLARSLLGSGVGGAGVAAAFHAAATEALTEDPALSAKLFAAAVAAGRPLVKSASGWARASALAGDLDSALRLADQAISGEDPAGRIDGARVAATALAHRGQLGRSAELYRWSGDGSFAMIGMIGTGCLDQVPAPPGDKPPTLLDGAASLMAQGVRESVTGSPVEALSALVRAAGLLEPAGRGVLLPDSPAALAALVALQCGELGVAESVLDRAVAANMGGPLLATRHRLLQAWICMMRGQLSTSASILASTRPREPRDWLFAVALEVGLARRNSDVQTLRRIWSQACDAVVRHPVDLFTLLTLGEFVVAAAKLGDEARLGPHLLEAKALAARLGDPSLWLASLHWSNLHAAIVAEKPADEHVTALSGNPSGFGQRLAEAAQCWLDLMAGKVDPVRAETAARGLHDAGMWWDGARLAGQAAIRTSDRKAMVTLLDCARELQGRQAAADPTPPTSAESPLSEREQEVAALVLQGMTYKQVGDQLFISAKTVEHHMARMRQRLGATSRSELLNRLRTLTSRSPGSA